MDKNILIIGNKKELVHALIREYIRNNDKIITNQEFSQAGIETDSDNHKSGTPHNPSILNVKLNLRSPLSVRSFVLEGLNAFGAIDRAVMTCSLGEENRVLHDLPVMDIERRIDQEIKGVFFALREIISFFWKRRKGTISIVLHTSRASILLPLEAAVYGSLKEMTESIFTQYKNEPLSINAFESNSENIDDFASFIIKNIEEKGERSFGKWFRHSEKSGFLSGISFPNLGR